MLGPDSDSGFTSSKQAAQIENNSRLVSHRMTRRFGTLAGAGRAFHLGPRFIDKLGTIPISTELLDTRVGVYSRNS